jgi:8-oxo-dGTP pyrophosphatase MutT (NUDIX family)
VAADDERGESGAPSGLQPDDASSTSKWRLLTRTTVYENRWLAVWHDEVVRPDGSEGTYGVVHFSTMGAWVAAIQNDRVLLVGQHRHPLGGAWSWELPAGKVNEGESPLEGARRELAEETGVDAKSWRELIRFSAAPGVSDLTGVCFEATDLSRGKASPDAIEDISVRWVTIHESLALIHEGTITDAGTQIALLRIALERGITPSHVG